MVLTRKYTKILKTRKRKNRENDCLDVLLTWKVWFIYYILLRRAVAISQCESGISYQANQSLVAKLSSNITWR